MSDCHICGREIGSSSVVVRNPCECADDIATLTRERDQLKVDLAAVSAQLLAETDGKYTATSDLDALQLSTLCGQLKARVTDLEQSLLLIGERAVVDFDNATVGAVDAVVREPERYRDWLREVMGKAERTEKAEGDARWLANNSVPLTWVRPNSGSTAPSHTRRRRRE